MRSMEFSGRSVDEAIFHGLNEMGVTIDEVEIETLQSESKGLFGIGSKLARVRLTERETPRQMEVEMPPQPREREPQGERAEHGGRGRGGDSRRSGGRDRGERRDRRDTEREEPLEIEQYDYSVELAAETPAAQFLAELLNKMNIEAEVLAAKADDGIRLCINSDTDGLLIGRRGETLDALQYIVSLHVNRNRKDEGYQRVTIDTESYRARREETLRRLARKNAARVRATGRPVAMEAMNPYERRILHAALQGFGGVTTHSEGEEPNRRVIITPDR